MWAPVEVLGCLLSNSSQILEVSMFLQYSMETVEGLNVVFFLSTSPMVMEE